MRGIEGRFCDIIPSSSCMKRPARLRRKRFVLALDGIRTLLKPLRSQDSSLDETNKTLELASRGLSPLLFDRREPGDAVSQPRQVVERLTPGLAIGVWFTGGRWFKMKWSEGAGEQKLSQLGEDRNLRDHPLSVSPNALSCLLGRRKSCIYLTAGQRRGSMRIGFLVSAGDPRSRCFQALLDASRLENHWTGSSELMKAMMLNVAC